MNVSVRVRVRVRVTVMVQIRVMVQTQWNHTPHTMESTRQYGHCSHNGIIHQTLCMLSGIMDTIGAADTRKPYRTHYGHTEYTRKTYTGRNIHHKQPWTPCVLQRSGDYTTDKLDTTRIHGQFRHQGTIQQTICTIPGTMDTMGNG